MSRDPGPSPLPREPSGPSGRRRNRCRGVSPGLNDSELRPTGNRELSFRRCAPASVSSRRQRELWARRMGAGEGDPAGGTGKGASERDRGVAGRVGGWQGKGAQGRARRLQARGRAWGTREVVGGRQDPVLALTLTHSAALGEALPLPGPRFPRLLTGMNDLSPEPPAAPGGCHPPGWMPECLPPLWTGRTGWVAAQAGERCQMTGTQQGHGAKHRRAHPGSAGRSAGKAVRAHVRDTQEGRDQRHWQEPGWGQRTWGRDHPVPCPRPTCPICLPALGELRLWGAPQALGAASPVGPRAWPPMEAPLPPGPHQPLHLVCQPAALPGGKRAREGVRAQRKRARGSCWGCEGKPSRGRGLGLGLSWAGVRGQAGARLGGPRPRGRRGHSLGPGQGSRLQHAVLVHDLLHQLLLLAAQGVELVPGGTGRGVGGEGVSTQHEAPQGRGRSKTRGPAGTSLPGVSTLTHSCGGDKPPPPRPPAGLLGVSP